MTGLTPTEIEAQRVKAGVLSRLVPGTKVESPRIGRFTVLRLVGQGGMGVVYEVYDGQLDRRVALKLLAGDAGPQLQARLKREALALAKLSHPNVVPVFEVGEHEGTPYIVMEYVEGKTLRDWQGSASPPTVQILDAYVQAGQGLAAAHAVGLVHRDFKPDNAIVGSAGRVRVLDFGLARRPSEQLDTAVGDEVASMSGTGELETPMTATGAVMGTPLYMAPEQFRGESVDHRTDQFSFCVALWEALAGEHPFGGTTPMQLLDRVTSGKLRDGAKLPAGVRAALVRGLSVAADERFGSMAELLDALRPRSRRQPAVWISAAALLAIGAGAIAWPRVEADQCTGAAEQLVGTWDDDKRARTEAAMLETGVPFARASWDSAAGNLDDYAEAWRQMYTDNCRATTVRGEQSEAVMDLRMACLQRAKIDLGAVVNVLANADVDVVIGAFGLTKQLPQLDRCADIDALQSDVAPPRPEERAAVERARVHIAAADAERRADRPDNAEPELAAAREIVAGIDYGPLQTELWILEGNIHRLRGNYDGSNAALEDALESAAQWRQWSLMGQAATGLMINFGSHQKRPELGHRYAALARGLAQGDPDAQRVFHVRFGSLLRTEGRFGEAEAEERRAIAMAEAQLGPDSLPAFTNRSNLVWTLLGQGRFEEGEAEIRRVIEIAERVLPAGHPDLAKWRGVLAPALHQQRRYGEAIEAFREALEGQRKALGPESLSVATAHQNLGVALIDVDIEEAGVHLRRALQLKAKSEPARVAAARVGLAIVLRRQGKLDEAAAELHLALTAREEALGPDHHSLGATRYQLAAVLVRQGRIEEALAQSRRALAIREKSLGPDHIETGWSHDQLGDILHQAGEHDEALASFRRAMQVFGAPGKEHHGGETRLHLTELLMTLGRDEEALEQAERSWEINGTEETPPTDRAQSAFLLALALEAAGGPEDAPRIRELVELARRVVPDDAEDAPVAEDIDAWLAEH